ncbi:hypothetical protein RT717_18845 [Imperialibacter roseus]|uniref:IrrE N-terminal-like domain-containing protein n=1 Tax=Imperialibacter roseus TaxID=1324217 RepID=A0ABZ0ILS9_9BACT|nr:hypothetical protein [Imperialibacter roseus]WOK05144.1 hypothetical protein RT717_18845 [Imperialibacter roseus]
MKRNSIPTESSVLKVLGLVGMFALTGCGTNVPHDVSGYVDSFIREAELRGHDFSNVRRGLTIEFINLPDNKAGSSKRTFFSKTIKLAPLIWKQMNDRQREMLVFHELGHCVLERQHKNERLLLGECASIMKEGGEDACVDDIFSDSWRSYYIDELFDPAVQVPDWYRTQDLTKLVIGDTLLLKEDSLQYESFQTRHFGIADAVAIDESSDYLLTLTYDSLNFIYGFQWDAITVGLYQESGEYSINNKGKEIWDNYSLYTDKIKLETPISLSLLKLGASYHFYLNGVEKHIMSTTYFQSGSFVVPGNMYVATYGGSKPTAKLSVVRVGKQ